MAPQIVIFLLVAITVFLYLALGVRKQADKRRFFYLYIAIDLWLAAVFLYLIISAVLD
ncbi:MAG: hypothetical protein ACI9LO_003432 [Planctomycetota bacterium]|jgi:hypothetical protein